MIAQNEKAKLPNLLLNSWRVSVKLLLFLTEDWEVSALMKKGD
jgi:hypothetical protein